IEAAPGGDKLDAIGPPAVDAGTAGGFCGYNEKTVRSRCDRVAVRAPTVERRPTNQAGRQKAENCGALFRCAGSPGEFPGAVRTESAPGGHRQPPAAIGRARFLR